MQSRTVKPGYQEVLDRQNPLHKIAHILSKSLHDPRHLAVYLPHDSRASQLKLKGSLDDCLAVTTNQW